MPPRARISREAILDAAFAIVRNEGHGALTVRRLASALGCSTQPILYHFDGIARITDETYRRADAWHTAWLTDGLERDKTPLLALGLRYIRFAAEEKPLFRFLFQSDRFTGRTLQELTADQQAGPLIGLVAASAGLDHEAALTAFRALFVAVHGYASLLANNAMEWDLPSARALLTRLYNGLTSQGSDRK